MLRLKSEIIKLLKKHNIKRSSEDIFIAEKNTDGYVVSFIVSFGCNDIVFVYDETFGYMSFFYKK